MRIAHLGAGPIIIKSSSAEWVNIDISDQHNPDVCMDYLNLNEVYGDSYFDHAFSVHSLEHVPFPEGVVHFFQVVKQTLKPGGILHLVVPDLKKIATAYVNGSSLKEIYDGSYFSYKDCPAERFMFFCRGWEHTVLFDFELLKSLMEDARFSNVQQLSFNHSQVPEMAGRDRFESESMVIEGMA